MYDSCFCLSNLYLSVCRRPGLAPPQCKGRYYQQRVGDAYIAVCVTRPPDDRNGNVYFVLSCSEPTRCAQNRCFSDFGAGKVITLQTRYSRNSESTFRFRVGALAFSTGSFFLVYSLQHTSRACSYRAVPHSRNSADWLLRYRTMHLSPGRAFRNRNCLRH